MILELVVAWLHLLAAMAWIGGMVFIAAVLAPVTRDLPAAERTALFGLIGRQFRWVGWACIGVLLVTGTVNLWLHAPNWAYLTASRAGPVLAVKLLFVVGMLALSLLHDFKLGPRQVELSAARDGDVDPALAGEVRRLQRLVRGLAQVNLLLGLAVVAFGVALRWLW